MTTRYWKRKHEAKPSWKLEGDALTYRSSGGDWGSSYFNIRELPSRNNIVETDEHGTPLSEIPAPPHPSVGITLAEYDVFAARVRAHLEVLLNPQPEANAQ